eukprot:10822933-Prorocentrum_lima.AAC.1
MAVEAGGRSLQKPYLLRTGRSEQDGRFRWKQVWVEKHIGDEERAVAVDRTSTLNTTRLLAEFGRLGIEAGAR